MLLITCPWCGPRGQSEFTYGRDANEHMPALDEGDQAAWMEYVYWRANPKGMHNEYWHHSAGCRQWFVVRRDTLSHVIEATQPPHGERAKPPADQVAAKAQA